jgi:hypothetical protein
MDIMTETSSGFVLDANAVADLLQEIFLRCNERTNPMRGLRLDCGARRAAPLRGPDGSRPALHPLRGHSDARSSHAARALARHGGRTLAKIHRDLAELTAVPTASQSRESISRGLGLPRVSAALQLIELGRKFRFG